MCPYQFSEDVNISLICEYEAISDDLILARDSYHGAFPFPLVLRHRKWA